MNVRCCLLLFKRHCTTTSICLVVLSIFVNAIVINTRAARTVNVRCCLLLFKRHCTTTSICLVVLSVFVNAIVIREIWLTFAEYLKSVLAGVPDSRLPTH